MTEKERSKIISGSFFTDYGTKDQPAEKAPDPPRPCVEDLFDKEVTK